MDCGAPIGAQRYDVLQTGNTELGQVADQTKTGYAQVANITEGLREMSQFETELLSLVLHLALLSASILNTEDTATFCLIPPVNLENYLMLQINNKIRNVATLRGVSQDDIFVLLGEVIKMLNQEPAANFNLLTKQGRDQWEKQCVKLMHRCLDTLPQKIEEFKDAAKEDMEMSALQKIINVEEDLTPLDQLLRVRLFRVTTDNLLQWILSKGKDQIAPTLTMMLEDIDVTAELLNLPVILELQEYVLKKFSGKISSADMEDISIADFSMKIEERDRKKFHNMVEVLLETWKKCKDRVFQFGGVMAEKLKMLDCYNNVISNPQTIPAAFLFPASKGSGLCSYALVMFLIQKHNLIVKSDHAPINPYRATQVQIK